jgi:predicted Zn-dependent protease
MELASSGCTSAKVMVKVQRLLHPVGSVINSPDVNAFVAPGGKVVVFSGAA